MQTSPVDEAAKRKKKRSFFQQQLRTSWFVVSTKKNNNAKANPRIFNGQRQQRESFDVRMLVKIRGKRKSSETFSVVGEELKFFCANEPVPRSTGGRERLCTNPGKKPRKEFLWDKRLYGGGGGGLPRKRWLTNPDSWRGEGEDERVGGGLETGGTFREKWLYEVGKTFGTKRKEKVATVGTLPPRNVTVIGSFIARL